jgi:cytochrome b6-f complex iron-sulfur subunit
MAVAIVILVVLALAVVVVLATAGRRRASTGTLSRETRRRDAGGAPAGEAVDTRAEAEGRERAEETRAAALEGGGLPAVPQPALVSKWEPVDEEEIGVTRRQFLNRGLLTAVLFSISGFGASVLAFLWPTNTGGFGGVINAGNLDDIFNEIDAKKAPFYVPEARTYLQRYPQDALDAAKGVKQYQPIMKGLEEGVVALYQKCVHLGCRVPWCQSSQWFECPCHGSKYNRVGEKKGGPAPRGLDHWPVTISGSSISIDTRGTAVPGAPIGTNTTKQQQEGPSCV